ncbi:MAG: DUF5663 domain-containing protein [bacterium]
MKNIEDFVKKMLEEKGFDKQEPEVVEEMKKDLLKRVEERIHAVIVSNLPEEKLKEFTEMLNKDIGDEEMQNFCTTNIPGLDQLIASELIVFRQTYLS